MFSSPLFFLIAGEASGDVLGARLMQALKKLTNGHVRFAGIGGERMQDEGLAPLFAQSELSHMGIVEVICHLPALMKRIRETVQAVRNSHPAALITIDSPDFCFRVAKALKGQGVPLIHYVAPTVWAWRPGRAKKIAKFLDHLLALLPFEPPYFTNEGLACTFVGHPLVESDAGKGDAARFRAEHNLAATVPILAVLPGSRVGEIKRLLPVFRATVARLKERHRHLVIAIPTLPHVKKLVSQSVADWALPVVVTLGDTEKYDMMAAATAGLACSGTVSVELAMAKLPSVIAYKTNAATAALVRRVIRVKFATLINIMKDREVMPEYIQEKCTPDKLADAVDLLLRDADARMAQAAQLGAIAEWLGRGQFVPSERAAQVVLDEAQKRARP